MTNTTPAKTVVIALYVVRVGSRDRKFYIRPEGNPNTKDGATRFADAKAAYDHINRIDHLPVGCEIRIRPLREGGAK